MEFPNGKWRKRKWVDCLYMLRCWVYDLNTWVSVKTWQCLVGANKTHVLTLFMLYADISAQSEKAYNVNIPSSSDTCFSKKWVIIAVSNWKSSVSIGWCEIRSPSLFWPSLVGRGPLNPFTPNPTLGVLDSMLHWNIRFDLQHHSENIK